MNLSWKILNLLAKLESRRNITGEPTFNEINARIKNIIDEHDSSINMEHINYIKDTLAQVKEIMLTINGLSKENSIHEVLSTRVIKLLDTFNDKQQ